MNPQKTQASKFFGVLIDTGIIAVLAAIVTPPQFTTPVVIGWMALGVLASILIPV